MYRKVLSIRTLVDTESGKRKMDEVVRKEVMERLQQVGVGELLEIITGLSLTVADDKKTNKRALFNIVMRHLSSEAVEDAEDEGLATFLKLNDDLKEMLEAKGKVKKEQPSVDSTGTGGRGSVTAQVISAGVKDSEVAGMGAGTTKIDFHKLREFKITGGTVGGRGDNAIDYMTLCYRMIEGKEVGNSQREVRTGVEQ